MRLVLNVSPTMTTEYRIENFSVCRTLQCGEVWGSWWGGEGGGLARRFCDVQVVCLMYFSICP